MKIKVRDTFENKTNKAEWHDWFCWYPVHSIEYGWVWLRWVHRKAIPKDYVDQAEYKHVGALITEHLTGCWHRIPERAP